MDLQANIDTLPKVEANSARRAVWAAFFSVFVPGLGQLLLGKKRSGWIFLALFAAWIWLFLPPFRLPKFYPAVVFLIFAAAGLMISASWIALRSGSGLRRAGSLRWLLVLVPLGCILAAAYWGIAVHLGGFHVFKVPSTAMEPTILPGDSIMVDMRYFEHHRIQDGEVVILKSPLYRGVVVVKRIAAMGGDTIQSVDGQISLNGKVLKEPYVKHIGHAPDWLMNFGPTLIPAHKLFVMGDNRDLSLDSRAAGFGLVAKSAVIGKVLYIVKAGRTGKAVH